MKKNKKHHARDADAHLGHKCDLHFFSFQEMYSIWSGYNKQKDDDQ